MRVVGYLIGALVSVVAASLLFRHLTLHEAGHYVTALSLVAIVGALSDLGLTAVGVREMAAKPPRERWVLARDLLGLRITLTLIGGLAVTLVAWLAYSRTVGLGVALACVGLLLQATQDNFALPLLVGLRLGWISALDLSRQLLTTLVIVALVLGGARLLPFLAVSIPVGSIVLVGTLPLVRGAGRLVPTFSFARWRRFVGPMLPYTLAAAASALYFRVSILMVSALSSGNQEGYFGASFRIIEVLTVVPGLLVGSAFPVFARAAHDDHERLGYAVGKVFQVAVVLGAWVAVSIAVAAPLGVAIVGGSKYGPAGPVLAAQGVALGAMFVSLVWANALLSLGLFRTILGISLASLALNAALVGLLVPLDGARGAAIGTAAAEIVGAIAQGLAVVRGRPRLRPSLRVLPYVACAATLGLAPLAFTGVPTIARLAISTVLFAAVVLVSHSVPPEVFDLVPAVGPLSRFRRPRGL